MKRLFVGIADVHRRNTRPVCRTEPDIMEVQDLKLYTVSNYARRYGIPICIAGDTFDTWHCGYDVTNTTLSLLSRNRIFACFGQHELPDHDIQEAHRSPLTTLLLQNEHSIVALPAKYRYLHVETASWKQPVPKLPVLHERTVKVLLMHKTVYLDEKPYPDATGDVRKLIKKSKYQQYDVVLTGDNHKAFKYRYGNTLWVNCGCLYRVSTTERNYEPCFWVFYWDDATKTVKAKAVPVPFEKKHVSKEHLEDDKQEKEWDSQFAEHLKRTKGCRPSSFVENVHRAVRRVKDDGVERFASNFLDFEEQKKGKR